MKKNFQSRERAKSLMKAAGYKSGGAVKEVAKKAVHKHEKHDHPGKKLTKLKEGGFVHGGTPKKRLDKPSRKLSEEAHEIPKGRHLARGGKASKGKGKTQVNVIVAGGKGAGGMPPAGMPASAGAIPPRPMPPRPMPPVAAGGMPPGAMPPGAKRGGAIKKPKYPIDDASGGGEGRLEKAAASKKRHKNKGGKC